MTRPSLGIVLLTFNSIAVIERTIAAARRVGGTIVAVDSGSTDGTCECLSKLGCEVLTRPFLNYADQRNWAIDSVNGRFVWQLHLDADEVLDEIAIGALARAIERDERGTVYLLHRRTYFMGERLRFGGTSNWHLRLFASGGARCENRLYDQHFISELPRRRLSGWIDDLNVGNLSEWTNRHNRWSSLEAEEMSGASNAHGQQVPGRLSHDPRERRRFYKGFYYKMPRALRAFALFGYRYVLQFGFLDGRAGLYYVVLQTLWFRVLVDAKLTESELGGRNK